MIFKYLLPFSRLSFHFVDSVLCCADAFQFDVAAFVYFCFKNILLTTESKIWYLTVKAKKKIVLDIVLNLVI